MISEFKYRIACLTAIDDLRVLYFDEFVPNLIKSRTHYCYSIVAKKKHLRTIFDGFCYFFIDDSLVAQIISYVIVKQRSSELAIFLPE